MKLGKATYAIIAQKCSEALNTCQDLAIKVKLQAINTTLTLHMTREATAKIFHISTLTLSKWINNFYRNGIEGLKEKPKTGRKALLDDTQLYILWWAIHMDPNEFGYNVWEGKTIADFIEKEFSIKYTPAHCTKVLKKINIVRRRPQKFPSRNREGLEEKREQFIKERDKKIESNEYEVVQEDEVHFKLETSIGEVWASKGSEPKVSSQPGNDKQGYIGFTINERGVLITIRADRFTAETILSALSEFCFLYNPKKGKKFLIFWDNAAWHKKAARLIETDKAYKHIKEKVEIMFLPPYSPDLNPIEQVWRKARREVTHNKYFKTMEEKAMSLDKWFRKFEKPNEELKSLINWAA